MISEEGLVLHLSLDETQGKVTKESISNNYLPIEYVFNDAKDKPVSDPLWRKGISGNCLLFDGYSTYIEYEKPNLLLDSKSITLTAWVAPRTYDQGFEEKLSTIVEQIQDDTYEGFILGLFREGTWAFKLGTGYEWLEVKASNNILPKGVWSFISATFDYETYLLTLYLNGIVVAERSAQKGTCFKPAAKAVTIGKNTQVRLIENLLNFNIFSGFMDELKIYNRALSQEDILKQYNAYLEEHNGVIPLIRESDINLDRSVYEGDRYRPQYHLMPAEHWMNEPHAPIYFNGQYHIFYQSNPKGPFFYFINWGHLVSDDMVHWRDLPIALIPEENAVDPAGCWSGSATYDEKGLPIIFYTAGDFSKCPNQRTAIARCNYLIDRDNDLTKWNKYKEPVTELPKGEGFVGNNFRDPFVFKQGNEWIQIVGSSRGKQGGTALVYVSKDLYKWSYKGPVFLSDFEKYPQTGTNWELPVLLPIGKKNSGMQKYIFIINANEVPHDQVDVYYWLGNWDAQNYRFIPDHDDPKVLDIGGGHFTGPSGFVTPDGRCVVFSIAQDRRIMSDQLSAGWAHNGGLPISLGLSEDSELTVEPIRELLSLRKECLLHLENKELTSVNEALNSIQGDMLEIVLDMIVNQEPEIGISIKRSKNGEEETVFKYSQKNNFFYVDRNKTCLTPHRYCKGIQGGQVKLKNNELSLHLYLDKSMIEMFINQQKCLTTRAYNSLEDSLGVKLIGFETTTISKIDIWSLDSCYNKTN